MKNKIITILILALAAITANAQDDFDPVLPGEPNASYKVTVSISHPDAGTVYGGGNYSSGRSITIRKSDAYLYSDAKVYYKFKHWTLNGVVYTTSESFTYVVGAGNADFVAVYEVMSPDEVTSKIFIEMSPYDAGYSHVTNGQRYFEGSSVYIYCYANEGFEFQGWYEGDTLISSDMYFYYTVGKDDSKLTAKFVYNPTVPQEPEGGEQSDVDNSDPTRKLVTLTIGNEANAHVDKTRVVFNEEKLLEYEAECDAAKFISDAAAFQIYSLDGTKAKYSINERPTDTGIVPIGIIVKSAGSVTISTSRLDIEDAILLDKVLKHEHPLCTGAYTFASAAGTFENRFELRIPGDVLLGDVNEDGKVDVLDVRATASILVGNPGTYNQSAADVNGNGVVDVADLVKIIDIVNQSSGETEGLDSRNGSFILP